MKLKDPRSKVYELILVTLLILITNNFIATGLMAILIIGMAILYNQSVISIIRSAKRIYPIIFITAFLNLILAKGNVILSIGLINITDNGIYGSLLYIIKFLLVTWNSTMIIKSMSFSELLDGLTEGLYIKNEYAMSIAIAFNFISVLNNEMDRIIIAQAQRGMDIRYGNVVKRVKGYVSILIPLFNSAIDKTRILADAMDVRCYNDEANRTNWKK